MNKTTFSLKVFYLLGTAVAVSTALLVAFVIHVMVGKIYPELHRDRTVYVTGRFYSGDFNAEAFGGGYSKRAIEDVFSRLDCVEVATGVSMMHVVGSLNPASAAVGKRTVDVRPICTDTAFFRMYELEWVDGRAFTRQQFEDGEDCVVITDQLARQLFDGETRVAGRTVLLGYKPFRITGVVRAGSNMLPQSSADIYVPYTNKDAFSMGSLHGFPYAGYMEVRCLLKEGSTRQTLLDQLAPYRAAYISEQTPASSGKVDWVIRARSHYFFALSFFDADNETTADYLNQLWIPALIMLLLLLLPAINMSALVSGMMEGRLAELGVRKAFGATNRTLLRQVLTQNLWFTCLGGILGLLLCYGLLKLLSTSTLFITIFTQSATSSSLNITPDMLWNWPMLIITFVCCALLNLMAAFIPVWHSLKRPLVEAMNQKQ
ncbi:MAG: ABC transporter permease [Bacteroidaceae bacterium]|nr:ABC transporter permease [Bacteroidaceae bacterium]